MMKNHIKIFMAILLLLGACKTQKPVVQNDVLQAPVTIIQPKADTLNYNYSPPPRNYSVPKKIFKELENYETAFDELKSMLEGTKEPNFERAVFISENPYNDNKFTYEQFRSNIDFYIFFINKLIEANDKSDSIDFNVKVNQYGRFNLDDIRHMPDEKKALYKNSVANWAIFTYLTDTTNFYSVNHLPFTYASQDPFGIKNWSNSQVINLLYSPEQKGNCFTLTAFYKILSDRLQSDARICTAPQHIYIQHRDKKGDYYNVELATAGHPGDGTIQTLTHTTTEAIKSGIALRSFDAKQSIGLCLVNLAKSYERKFGSKDDDFLLKCAELVLRHDPLNLNALLLKQQILDVRVTNFALENNINDINKLKASNEISETVNELENHLSLLYRLGYRQMPYDMQEIIMTGIFPKDFKDKNPSPFTTIDPKDEHRKSFKTLYGGLFQEVFEISEFEPYGHFTFQTTTGKITLVDTTAQTGFLIDPVAFAYDFGARMYDARLGIFTSVDPLAHKMAGWSPYAAFADNPILYIDPTGEIPWPVMKKWATSTGTTVLRRIDSQFGMRTLNGRTRQHQGVDINLGSGRQDLGVPVYATHDGVVAINKDKSDGNDAGNRIHILSEDGNLKTVYMHLKDPSAFEEGSKIKEGDIIGYIGGTAKGKDNKVDESGKRIAGTDVHLHYELHTKDKNGNLVPDNPLNNDGTLKDPQKMLGLPTNEKLPADLKDNKTNIKPKE